MVELNRRVQLSDMFQFYYLSICALFFILTFENTNVYALPPRALPNPGDNLQNKKPLNVAGLGNGRQEFNGLNNPNGQGFKPIGLPDQLGQNGLKPGIRNNGGVGPNKNLHVPVAHKNVLLASHEDCQEDVERLCSASTIRKNNFAILDCLQGDMEIQVRF